MPAHCPAPFFLSRWRNWWIRGIFMVAMIIAFVVLIHAGRIALSVLVRKGWEGRERGGRGWVCTLLLLTRRRIPMCVCYLLTYIGRYMVCDLVRVCERACM